MLTGEQQRIVELFLEGHSFFLSGKGGRGKTYVVKHIIDLAKSNNNPEDIAVTGPTGKSAENIGGQTLHLWAGIGLGIRSRYQLLDQVLASRGMEELQTSHCR